MHKKQKQPALPIPQAPKHVYTQPTEEITHPGCLSLRVDKLHDTIRQACGDALAFLRDNNR